LRNLRQRLLLSLAGSHRRAAAPTAHQIIKAATKKRLKGRPGGLLRALLLVKLLLSKRLQNLSVLLLL
jgi:hypothetical protein